MHESNGNELPVSPQTNKVQANISATIAEQLEDFSNHLDDVVNEVSDAYVLNIIAAKKYEFLLDLTTTIEQKLNQHYSAFLHETLEIGTAIIGSLNEQLSDRTLIKEQTTAKRIQAGKRPNLQLQSYQEILEQKRNKQSNLLSLKVPENPTNSDKDAIDMLGISIEEIKQQRKNNTGEV